MSTTGKTALLTRDQILKVNDYVTQIVDVPEWGGSVMVKGLTGKERDDFEASMVDEKNRDRQGRPKMNLLNVRARFVSLVVVDESGRQLFNEGDIMALTNKNASALDRVWRVARVLSGMSDEDLKELVGNSSGDQTDDSPSSSPSS